MDENQPSDLRRLEGKQHSSATIGETNQTNLLALDNARLAPATKPNLQDLELQPADLSKPSGNGNHSASSGQSSQYSGVMANEPLLDGFVLLRLVQLLNFDVYYIVHDELDATAESRGGRADLDEQQDLGGEHKLRSRFPADDLEANAKTRASDKEQVAVWGPRRRLNLMEEIGDSNAIVQLVRGSRFLSALCRYLKIVLSLLAIMISVDKTLSTIFLCLMRRIDIHSGSSTVRLQAADNGTSGLIGSRPMTAAPAGAATTSGAAYEASDVTMGWFVLVLVNLSAMSILFSTVFNGHLLWNLLSQRLFLVSRRFQYKTMLCLLVFVYLEYIINISFINNLYGWPLAIDDLSYKLQVEGSLESAPSGGSGAGQQQDVVNNGNGSRNSFSVMANLERFVTEQDQEHDLVDVLLTIVQFARGVIRISPYITINYVIICLKEHIKTIRNQYLLTESLKKRQKLRLVVKNRRVNLRATNGGKFQATGGLSNGGGAGAGRKPKRVIFATETSGLERRASITVNGQLFQAGDLNNGSATGVVAADMALRQLQISSSSASSSAATSPGLRQSAASPISLGSRSASSLSEGKASSIIAVESSAALGDGLSGEEPESSSRKRKRPNNYLDRVRDFDELESYITNLYIFTGRLNRLMSAQGLAMFFIVHNLIISCALIVPEAVRGGPLMAQLIRLLVILIGIVPFVCGQSLSSQLEQLSKQIDRIIIQQQFVSRRRDNLVRIRELLHDIRVNCGGMLNFDVKTGIKYLVVAFASAFFVEQEGEWRHGWSNRCLWLRSERERESKSETAVG